LQRLIQRFLGAPHALDKNPEIGVLPMRAVTQRLFARLRG
jgi:hypothetical protein